RVETASDGEEALNAIGTRDYDLVLLDIDMPKLTGLDVLDRLRAQACGKRQQPAVVVLTASDAPTDRKRAAVYPRLQGYLVKPLDRNSVRNVLSAVRCIDDDRSSKPGSCEEA
ncbi:MAG: response regulator, partial [Myxococcota bacterium]